tara:strand:+ start:2136 stop:2993 length:858 start_codon:yes stop_codon:yes gene_type:complete
MSNDYGFIVKNADGDTLLSTQDDNQFMWIDDYTSSGVTYYASGTATVTGQSSNTSQTLDAIAAAKNSNGTTHTTLDLTANLLFLHIPASSIIDDTQTNAHKWGDGTSPNYKGGAFYAGGQMSGVGSSIKWLSPRIMNNFTGAMSGYGVNVFDSNGAAQANLIWSSNAQGHLDIVAAGKFQDIGNNLWVDYYFDASTDYYVLVSQTGFWAPGGNWAIVNRHGVEFYYGSDGNSTGGNVRLRFINAGNSPSGGQGWGKVISGRMSGGTDPWFTGFGQGWYMIVKKRL